MRGVNELLLKIESQVSDAGHRYQNTSVNGHLFEA
jgi:hypothetical protein